MSWVSVTNHIEFSNFVVRHFPSLAGLVHPEVNGSVDISVWIEYFALIRVFIFFRFFFNFSLSILYPPLSLLLWWNEDPCLIGYFRYIPCRSARWNLSVPLSLALEVCRVNI